MNIKDFIKYSTPVVFLRILYAKFIEVFPETKYLATANLKNNAKKLHTNLYIRTHALEKGMSIGRVRYGFGKSKALSLIKDLQLYLKLGGDKQFVIESCSIIQRYIIFNEKGGADMSIIHKSFEPFCKNNKIEFVDYGGIYELKHSLIKDQEHAPFDIFSQSRYSIRDFGKTPVREDDIKKALKLAERTPSACNRQSQRIHVYLDKDLKDKICNLQLGCRGFIDDIQGAILVCCDLGCYNFHELNLAYVDGGLYAMNLLYSLHYYDIATIPLTMAHKPNYIKKILKMMDISYNEVPVLLIAIGSFKDEWRVAQSHRKEWDNYTTFDK